MRVTREHIIGLDLIRFAAAAAVTVFHLAYWSWAPADSLTRSVSGGVARFPELASWTWSGWVGVEVFFVLSGFVIAWSADGASAGAFLRSRVVRLYPAAWICATATLAAVLSLGRAGPDTAVAYLHAMLLWVQGPWIDGVYWTLGIEIVFYLFVLLVLLLRGSSALPLALCVLAGWSSFFWLALAAARMSGPALGAGWLHDVLASAASAFLLLRHGCLFALGGLMWLCLCRRATPVRLLFLALCVVAGSVEILDAARATIAPIGDTPARRLLPVTGWLLAICAMAASVIGNDRLQAWLHKVGGAVRMLGLMTYPLYLLHDVIGAGVLRIAVERGVPPAGALVVAVGVPAMLAWAVTRHLEPPLKSWLRARLTGQLRRPRPAQ